MLFTITVAGKERRRQWSPGDAKRCCQSLLAELGVDVGEVREDGKPDEYWVCRLEKRQNHPRHFTWKRIRF